MDASLVDSPLHPRQFWLLLAAAAALPGCPPTDDYFLSQVQPSSTGTSTGTGGQAPELPPIASPECGNGVAEGAEGCDGSDFRGASCELLGLSTGQLGCVNCKFDIAGCASKATVCGDGKAEDAEGCDVMDLRGASCEILGFDGGTLGCTTACFLDTLGCISEMPVAVCGNGSAEEDEVCDGLDLRGQSCQGLLGQASGTLRCTTECKFDASDCATHVAVCGDNVAEGVESCDGVDLRKYTCEMVGMQGGKLGCTEGCSFDTTGCTVSGTGCEPQGGAGGTGAMCCVPTAEVCDGRSNDCNPEVDEGGVCPDGCTAQLYDGRLYLMCIHPQAATQRDYADASADCAAAATTLGLTTPLELARIESAAENDFVKLWIQERIAAALVTEGMVWNGANDIARETRWVWGQGQNAVQFFQGSYREGGGTPVDNRFNDFPVGRPNSANETDEDCGGFDSEAGWRWNDRLCTQRALGFICEQSDATTGMPPTDPTNPSNPWQSRP